MNKQEDYASDSDQSDEDFCPDKGNNSDAPSEEESDDQISENEDQPASNKKSITKKNTLKKQTKAPESPAKKNFVKTRNRTETATKSSLEKDELESDEEDSSRKEALWADFLCDVPTVAPSRTNKPTTSSRRNAKTEEEEHESYFEMNRTRDPLKEPQRVLVSEIFEFAGEEVRVEKAVNAALAMKRPLSSGGLGSLLGQIGKKKKLSVLEKTKFDWESFKTNEGIDEQLQTFNKGKDGYLQRQDFLERTDVRQFEIEKTIRQSRRKPM